MTSTWYVEGLQNEEEEWYKLVNPQKYLGTDENPFCKCGHHVKDHGYSSFFGEEYFCFHKCGDEGYKQIFVDYQGCRIEVEDDLAKSSLEIRLENGVGSWNRRCPCEGFEPYRVSEFFKQEKETAK
jgi:hypothetical protein